MPEPSRPARRRRGRAGPAARLDDVARRAGVSVATASRALNGAPGRVVNAELQERVRAAATELGYVSNVNAQAMARGRANLIGLIVHDIADPYFSTVAAGVMREAAAAGLLVTLASTERDPSQELAHVAAFRRHRARGVILVGSRQADDPFADRLAAELAAFEAEGGRAVAVSQPRLPIDTLAIDNAAGAHALAETLATLGYRDIAVLGGPRGLLTAVDRIQGFRDGLARHRIRLRAADVRTGAFTRDGGYAAMGRLLDSAEPVDCVFAVNDVMAVGAMACVRDRGLQVPRDVAVAGYDDISTLRDVTPALTTVRIDLGDVGSRAVHLLLSPATRRPRIETVPVEVIRRASTPAVDMSSDDDRTRRPATTRRRAQVAAGRRSAMLSRPSRTG